jgi:hypothetical protein
MIAAPPSAAARLATQTKAGASAPFASFSAKYFWLVRIDSWITSRGTARNAGSNRPASGTGHSASPAFSASSPGSAMSVPPAAAASRPAPSRMMAARSAADRITCASRN